MSSETDSFAPSDFLVEVLAAASDVTAEELAVVLLVRGRHALDSGGALPHDRSLRALPREVVRAAALHPGSEFVAERLTAAVQAVGVADDAVAEEAEEALAEVLDERDRWALRARGLEAIGLADLGADVRREIEALDGLIDEHSDALGDVAYLGEERRANAADPAGTIWRRVPPLEEILVEPARDVELTGGAFTDEQLAQAALGAADPETEARVARALDGDDALAARYDAVLADVAALRQPSEEAAAAQAGLVIPFSAVGPPSVARPASVAAAAGTLQPEGRYATPPPGALLYVYEDGAELYAQREGPRWVLFLYRATEHADDSFSGPVEDTWSEGRLLGAVVPPGAVEVRYAGAQRSLRLPSPQG